MRLFSELFSDDLNAPTAVNVPGFKRPLNIGIRWTLERFGIERIEVTIRPESRLTQFERYRRDFGRSLGRVFVATCTNQ